MNEEMAIAMLVFLFANLIDFLTTWRGLRLGFKEANPYMRRIYEKHGFAGLLAVKLFYVGVFSVAATISRLEETLWVGTLLLAVPYIWNSTLILYKLWRERFEKIKRRKV